MKIPRPSGVSKVEIPAFGTPCRLSYEGSGSELLWVYLKGAIFGLLSFGIYNFWAFVTVRKHLWKNTYIGEDSFSYHGTGRELFFGALKYFMLSFVTVIAIAILITVLSFPVALVAPMFAVGSALVFPYVNYLSRCFLLNRTELRGIRFGMLNEAGDYSILYLKHMFITVLTFGYHYPVFRNEIYSFKVNRMFYGDVRFSYKADHRPLRPLFLKCWLLVLPTLGLSMFWFKARESTYQISNTQLGSLRLLRSYQPVDLMIHEAIFFLGIIVTFGLATPWLFAWRFRYYVGRNAVVGTMPKAENMVMAKQPSGVVEAVADVMRA